MKYIDLVDKLTLSEKAQLVVGFSTWSTFPIDRLGVPSLIVSDGPTGLRKEKKERNPDEGIAKTEKATCFPTSSTLANSFNESLLYKVGEAIAKECHYYDVNMLLAPGINIKRNPLCGRNFEYFSEDPILTAKLAGNFVKGLEDNNVGVTLKHFSCNQNEKYRYNGSSNVDIRALHEIYLKAFELIVKEVHPSGIMSSYNKINGVYASDNKYLLTDILRDEWGFKGIVMSDWGGLHDRVEGLKAGLDLEMPGMNISTINDVIRNIQNKSLPIENLDNAVRNILYVIGKLNIEKKEEDSIFEDNYKLSVEAAIESSVLLKNDGTLPLKKDKKYLIVGDLFQNMRYQGAGSSQVNSYKFVDNVEAFKKANIEYEFVRGYEEYKDEANDSLIEEAISKANDYDEIIYFGGLTNSSESEGFDRSTYKLPNNQIELLKRLTSLNKKIIFVIYGGSSFEIPFLDKYNAILNMYLPGEGGGEALTKLLFGDLSPSGHLNETWPLSYDDVIFGKEYTSSAEENYKESIYVGYRYYSCVNKKVAFPFGHGLTYSDFEYKDMHTSVNGDNLDISFVVKNIGNYKASAVPQIYVSKKDSLFYRPKYELKGFSKVSLAIGESRQINIKIPLSYLSIYSTNEKRFFIEDGNYEIYLGENAEEMILKNNVLIYGEKLNPNYTELIKKHYFDISNLKDVSIETFEELLGRKIPEYIPSKRPYTLETPIGEFNSFFGKIIKNSLVKAIGKPFKNDLKSEDSKVRELANKNILFMQRMILSNNFRSLSYSSSGILKKNIALGLVSLSNGRIFKGLHYIFKKEKLLKE